MAAVVPASGAPVISSSAFGVIAVPGGTFTSVTSGNVTGGDPVEVSGDGTVAKVAGASSLKFVGIAAHDATSPAPVTIYTSKYIFDSPAAGAITPGAQLVASATANRGVAAKAAASTAVAADINDARAIVGVALTNAASDGNTVRWIMR